ncbi:MAG: beta galactosidase jelly roll domain-containing protein [Bacteroidetes bacterium]|nr:beta galactosidase jelly roll domain-containing protein [Bacteroidota bacterium]
MNRKACFKLSFLLLFVLFATSNNHLLAQTNYGNLVTPKNYKTEIDLDTLYKYKIGDDFQWATVDYDDSSWRSTLADSTDNDTILEKHQGIVWFRGKFKVDTSLTKNPFTIEIMPYGACDVYFDGKLVKKIGIVAQKKADYKSGYSLRTTMIPLSLNDKTEHVIAIRLSKFRNEQKTTIVFNGTNNEKACGSSLYDSEVAIAEESDFHQLAIMLILSTIFGVLGLFHFVLFMYYHKNRANLYYSLFSFMLFSIFFGLYTLLSGRDIEATTKSLCC